MCLPKVGWPLDYGINRFQSAPHRLPNGLNADVGSSHAVTHSPRPCIKVRDSGRSCTTTPITQRPTCFPPAQPDVCQEQLFFFSLPTSALSPPLRPVSSRQKHPADRIRRRHLYPCVLLVSAISVPAARLALGTAVRGRLHSSNDSISAHAAASSVPPSPRPLQRPTLVFTSLNPVFRLPKLRITLVCHETSTAASPGRATNLAAKCTLTSRPPEFSPAVRL